MLSQAVRRRLAVFQVPKELLDVLFVAARAAKPHWVNKHFRALRSM